MESALTQMPVLKRSTLSSGGAPNIISVIGTNHSVIQSIGQSSVIGSFAKNNIRISQGFLQPAGFKSAEHDEISKNADIYPNPFASSFSVLFPYEISKSISVLIFSMDGRIIYSKRFPPSREITLIPGQIPSGLYIVRIITDRHLFTGRVIKN